ncbi:MAG: hypothetical protein QOE55_7822, partial [Acidobacteriaceae bacterium]|nr:hypothetical protein [Acidobacteriaceae bacterium]
PDQGRGGGQQEQDAARGFHPGEAGKGAGDYVDGRP